MIFTTTACSRSAVCLQNILVAALCSCGLECLVSKWVNSDMHPRQINKLRPFITNMDEDIYGELNGLFVGHNNNGTNSHGWCCQ